MSELAAVAASPADAMDVDRPRAANHGDIVCEFAGAGGEARIDMATIAKNAEIVKNHIDKFLAEVSGSGCEAAVDMVADMESIREGIHNIEEMASGRSIDGEDAETIAARCSDVAAKWAAKRVQHAG